MVKSGMGERDWRPFVYGGLASCVAEFGTFPIDTTKTRLQIQGQKLDKNHATLKYNGMVDCGIKIFKQEGVPALYSGHIPGQQIPLMGEWPISVTVFGRQYCDKLPMEPLSLARITPLKVLF